jgi:hypothetical protein
MHRNTLLIHRPAWILAAACVLSAGSVASAQTLFGFTGLRNNDNRANSVGQDQLSVELTGSGDQACFLFRNTGSEPASLRAIYFQDSDLLGEATLTPDEGVAMRRGATPANLPGADTVDPVFEATLSFGTNGLGHADGIDPGEQLQICFTLLEGQTFEDVVEAMRSGELRIGVRVHRFRGGGSGSFVNNNPFCTADINGDGSMTVSDFMAYFGAYQAGNPMADFNDDDRINIQDFLGYLDAFARGC